MATTNSQHLTITSMIEELSPKPGFEYNPNLIFKRTQKLAKLLQYIAEIDQAITRDCYINCMAERLKTDRKELEDKVEKLRNPKPKRDFNEIITTISLVTTAISVLTLLFITLISKSL